MVSTSCGGPETISSTSGDPIETRIARGSVEQWRPGWDWSGPATGGPPCEGETFAGCPEPPPPSSPPIYEFDAVWEEPDCTQPQSNLIIVAYCGGRQPQGSEAAALTSAVSRIRSRGGACVAIADAADALLAAGRFRLFTRTTQSFAGGAQPGGDWALISDEWLQYWPNSSGDGRTLDSTIAHEIDHHLNHVVGGQTDSNGHHMQGGIVNAAQTLNSMACG
jgi:hypothetical protein